MLSLQVIENSKTIEQKLTRMKELKEAIKDLESEFNLLKNAVITDYFNQYEEYRNNKGRLLASYKLSERTQFNTTLFKNENDALYEKYCEVKVVSTFLLK